MLKEQHISVKSQRLLPGYAWLEHDRINYGMLAEVQVV